MSSVAAISNSAGFEISALRRPVVSRMWRRSSRKMRGDAVGTPPRSPNRRGAHADPARSPSRFAQLRKGRDVIDIDSERVAGERALLGLSSNLNVTLR